LSLSSVDSLISLECLEKKTLSSRLLTRFSKLR
jgi:hypothetical protein